MAAADPIGTFTPAQARLLWQDYQSRQQLQPQLIRNYPQRTPLLEPVEHRVFVKNTEEEAIPPFGCMRITGVEVIGGQTAITVEKPTDTEGEFLFNSRYEIAAEAEADGDIPRQLGVGWAYRHGVVIMLGDEPTEAGIGYVPIVDSWEIEEDSGGPFVVYGRHDVDDRALIGRITGGGSAGGFAIVRPTGEVCDGIGFTCDCAIATVITASCGSGVATGELLDVWDLCRLWLNMPPELLLVSTFYVQNVAIHEADDNRPPGLTGSCRWVVTGMCCSEAAYYGY